MSLKNESDSLGFILEMILRNFSCPVGTIHQLDTATNQLKLLIHRGIPDAVLPQIQSIPIGKGMAGLAAQRRECVSICNLQTDGSGDVRPSAKLTGMEGSIAVPMLVQDDLRGILGIAKPNAYTFTESEKKQLLEAAALIGQRL